MRKKLVLLSAVLAVVLWSASIAASYPTPPSSGQWALVLESPIRLYDEADSESGYNEIDVPEKWIRVPSATRDDDNYLWYKVTVNGETGWLPQNGVLLKMGPKSKTASNLYKKFVRARQRLMSRPRGWDIDTSGEYEDQTVYRLRGTEFAEVRVIETGRRVEDVYFHTEDAGVCEEFFGMNLIGLYQPSVRSKLGTPTMRQSPPEDRDINILTYELPDTDMTLVITERRYEGRQDARVEFVSLHRGRTNEPY